MQVYSVINAYRLHERLQGDYEKSVQEGCACQPKSDASIRVCMKEGEGEEGGLSHVTELHPYPR